MQNNLGAQQPADNRPPPGQAEVADIWAPNTPIDEACWAEYNRANMARSVTRELFKERVIDPLVLGGCNTVGEARDLCQTEEAFTKEFPSVPLSIRRGITTRKRMRPPELADPNGLQPEALFPPHPPQPQPQHAVDVSVGIDKAARAYSTRIHDLFEKDPLAADDYDKPNDVVDALFNFSNVAPDAISFRDKAIAMVRAQHFQHGPDAETSEDEVIITWCCGDCGVVCV